MRDGNTRMTPHARRQSHRSDRRRNRSNRPFCPEDEGKDLVTPDGDVVGSLVRVRGGDAYVEPIPGLLEGLGSWLTGTWDECEAFPLNPEHVVVRETRIVLDTTVRSVGGGRLDAR